MRITKISLPLLFIVTFTYSQDFCGHIKYQFRYYSNKNNNEVTSKVNDVKIEDFYVCGNKFKIYFDGVLKDIYIGDSLVYLHVYPDSTIGYIKADKAYGQHLPKYTNPKQNVLYKDKVFSTIDENSKNNRLTYYYNEDIRINPLTFENLEMFHWNKFFNVTEGGISLISISRTKKMTIIREAIEIKSIELRDSDFLPTTGYELKPFSFYKIKN